MLFWPLPCSTSLNRFQRPTNEFPSEIATGHNFNGCGRTRRVNWVYFSETWLKILNNLTRLKVRYNKIAGLHLMSGRTEMMADFEDHVVIFSILFLCFPFLSRRSRLRQSLLLLMRSTQISKAVLSTMMLISCRRQSVLHRRRMNRPRVWVYPRDQK